MNPSPSLRLSRREALKWMLSAISVAAILDPTASGADAVGPEADLPAGYGLDPDLTKQYRPGDLWPLTFTASQRRAAVALCDVIIPADAGSPAASAVGVPDFIDEWISAPYPAQAADRPVILDGLAWLDAEAKLRFQADFADLVGAQQAAICDDICYLPQAKPPFLRAARFFKRFRDLTAGGFYTLPEGTKDLGYVGNVPLATFEGPPLELIKKLGLDSDRT